MNLCPADFKVTVTVSTINAHIQSSLVLPHDCIVQFLLGVCVCVEVFLYKCVYICLEISSHMEFVVSDFAQISRTLGVMWQCLSKKEKMVREGGEREGGGGERER